MSLKTCQSSFSERSSLLQSRYGYKRVKPLAVGQGREGTQEEHCYLVSTYKSQDLPQYWFRQDQAVPQATGQWNHFSHTSVSYVGTAKEFCS